ncbi:MAG: MBL fold metallo-hydrolase [Nitrospirae bacterium]|nr:MBL fold metallo-hydrolase [Nitrospirota bacterium]
MFLETLVVGELQVNCYIIAGGKNKDAAVIDAGENSDDILNIIKKHNLNVKYIINTHTHFDHIGAVSKIKNATGAKFLIHEGEMHVLKTLPSQNLIFGVRIDAPPSPDGFLKDNDKLHLGDITLKILCTPGHSPGGICIYADGLVFTGDTLFAGSIGRTDLPGGDYNTIINSIKEKLLSLGDKTMVLPGHGPRSTIKEEKEYNPFLIDNLT